jgi:tRNA A-37 threonylcarbamoyl transferase component Bud32
MAQDLKPQIQTFGFPQGRTLANKYEVISRLGAGWEGEVYLLRETATGIDRAAKFFFPERNRRNKTLTFYARKLHKLRECPALIQYHTQETIHFAGHDISFLVSDYVEGEILQDFIEAQPGSRLDPFQGLHLLYCLTKAVEDIHRRQEYHGDLHSGNVIIRRRGLSFDVKLLDFFHWGQPTQENLRDDIGDVIRIFYDAIGGQARYQRHPATVKGIILGLKKTLILRKFRSISALREHLEQLDWEQPTHYN